MTDRYRDLTPVGSIMGGLARAPRTNDRLVAVREVWEVAVGPEICRNAYPVRLARDGTVVVHCSGSTWASELTLLSSHLKARLDERLGDGSPASLRFMVGELPVPDQPPAAPPPRAINPRAAEIAAAVSDPDLRRVLERAISVRFDGTS